MTDALPHQRAFIDTSVLVRYLTGDPPDLADQAARIIDSNDSIHLTDVVVVEAAYVLSSVYQHPRQAVVDALIGLIQKRNVTLFGLDKGIVIDALLLCRPSGRVSFGDAMIWAVARSASPALVYSFDARFPSDAIEVRTNPI
jgi:predicted nucleic acid-binding protein